MSRYEKINPEAFKQMTFGAGIILKSFDPDTGTVVAEDILYATNGGHTSNINREVFDIAEGLDNVPAGTKQLQRAGSWSIETSGTAKTLTLETLKDMFGSANVDTDSGKLTLRNDIALEDFHDIWIVANYSQFNGEKNGGFMAQHFKNALSMDGFAPVFTKDENGSFPFRYKAFYDMDNIDEIPYEVYLKAGTAETESATEEV